LVTQRATRDGETTDPSPRTSPAPAAARADLGLFTVSAAILTFEVLETRIFAFSLDAITIYLALSVCLLGLGASATLLALAPPLSPARAERVAGSFACAGGVLALLALGVFAWGSPALLAGGPGGVVALVTLVALTLPYLCLGFATALLMVRGSARIGRTYAVNLAGSGVGCLIAFPLLDHFGAERASVAVAAMAIAAWLILPHPRRKAALGLAAAIALAAMALWAPRVLVFKPDPSGQLEKVISRAARLRKQNPGARLSVTPVFSRWDRTARIDVYRLESSIPALASRVGGPLETLFFIQDASAGSILLGTRGDLERARDFFTRTVYGAGYAKGPAKDVLVIGLGGAPDVQAAIFHGAEHIAAVDINATTIEIVRGEFRDFLGDPYGRPGVTTHQVDGRTFLRRSSERFDLIQMSGADTKSLHASGALAVNENYLYTREAMRDLLEHLKPDGVLAINRFSDFELVRLMALAVEGLRELGAADPAAHLFSVRQGPWVGLVVKHSPFTREELERLHGFAAGAGPEGPEIVIPTWDWIRVSLHAPIDVVYSPPPLPVTRGAYAEALAGNRTAELENKLAGRGIDVRPPSDDRPFFFFGWTPWGAFRRPPPVILSLMRLAGWLAVVAAALILAPLLTLRRRGLRAPQAGRALVYFSCLGAGFMLLEIGLIHRFVLLLGHQSYAVTVVLFGLLAGSGLGSLASGSLTATPPATRRVIGALVAAILVSAAALGPIFHAAGGLAFPGRLAIALAVLVGLGFLLGMPFPAGLRAARDLDPALVAWALGVNGFAGVLATTLGVPIAMVTGLSTLLLLAALLYAVAILAAPVTASDVPRRSG
jgi:SAM-dependent methyltransferase